MRLDDCYRLLDLDPAASDEDVKRAHRDLTKVWHPDRFGHDPGLRQRAEEKLKAINGAYEAIRDSRGGGGAPNGSVPPGGKGDAGRQVRLERTRALLAAAAAVFLLLRRPTPAGLAISLALLGLSFFFFARMRSAGLAARG